MSLSKGSFVVLLMAVLSMLLLATATLALPPTVSVSGVPANVAAGTSFKATVTAINSTAGQTIATVTLVNNVAWPITPQNTVSCSTASCVAEFTVNVPSNAAVGTIATLTAQATANTAEVATAIATAVVSGTPVVPPAPVSNKVPVSIEAVEVDNFELSSSETNVRDLERGNEFELKVKLKALATAGNVEIRAFISGVDVASRDPTSASLRPFDVEKGVSYVKSLKLRLPESAAEDTYRIRVVVAGRDNEEIVQNFRIKVTPTDHEVVIRELSISPDETIMAGRAVLATVRVKNLGDSTEGDIKVKVSIPELGVSASPDFIDELKSDDSATSEEFFLRIDQCAKPGTYDVKAEVSFDDGDKVVSARKQIAVTKGPCEASPTAVATNGVKIIYSTEPQSLEAGGAAVAYPVIIANDGSAARTYSFSVAAADWASVRLSPSNVVTVKPGDSQTVYMFVAAGKSAAPGVETLVVRVKDQAGDVVKELAFSANVVGASAAPGVGVAGLAQLLQLGLVALIVVLVVVGLVVAFRRMKGPKEGEESTQTYY
ncbi:hypothetical protein HYU17_02270 [Candidatus Woesearchaeota archaeon]|nr:hypothetical protein [Candidatus Woesearchaeota archaeon]